jgi:hypothetical protein
LLALRETTRDASRKSGSASAQPAAAGVNRSPRKVKKPRSLPEILVLKTKDELVELLVNLAKGDEGIGQRIEWQFFAGNDEAEIKKASKLIRT